MATGMPDRDEATTPAGGTAPLGVGDRAPDFRLPAAGGDPDIERRRLRAELADGPVLLNFYLFDFHPHCTEHVCDLHDLAWFDLAESVTPLGVSTDTTYSHRAFAADAGVDVPLLADSDGTVAEAYGVLEAEVDGHRRVAGRSVFVIDQDRVVRYAWRADDPATQPPWRAVRAALADLGATSTAD